MSIISSFKNDKNKHGVYRGKDYMKSFYESLRKHAMKKKIFWKEKNEVINKGAAGIIWICKNLLHL